MRKLLIGLFGMLLVGAASAKLPPATDEANAKAAQAKEKSAYGDKVAGYQLCLAQDKLGAKFGNKSAAAPAIPLPACVNPGPFIAAIANTPATNTPAAPK